MDKPKDPPRSTYQGLPGVPEGVVIPRPAPVKDDLPWVGKRKAKPRPAR